jgi:hypothetical protein
MTRVFRVIAAAGLAALSAGACSGEDATYLASILPLTPAAGAGGAGSNTAPGAAGAGARGAGAAPGGTGGDAASRDAGVDAGVMTDAGSEAGELEPPTRPVATGDAGPVVTCSTSADCDDRNDCTTENCISGSCSGSNVAIGTPCGDTTTADECTQPDSCDGNGVCLANHEPDGALCADGHCNLAGVCDCAVERVTAVPYGQQWQTTADTEIDMLDLQPCQLCAGTRDHIVVFSAPADGTYRFFASSIGADVELTVFQGDCGAAPAELVCGADIDPSSGDLNDRLDLELAAGTTVSVAVGERCEAEGTEGWLSIERLP